MGRVQLKRCLILLPAVAACAFGVVLFMRADWGMDPLSSFEYGVSQLLPISMGIVSLIFEGLIFLLFFFYKRSLLGFGSAAFCFGIGPCINLFNSLVPQLPAPSIPLRIVLVLLGTLFITFGMAYYLPMNMGLQSLDLLSVSAASLLKKSYGLGLSAVYAILLLLSLLLGAPVGLGTVVSICCFGSIINRLLHFTTPLAARLGFAADSQIN